MFTELQEFSLRIFSIFRQRNWLSKELIFIFFFLFFEIYWWKGKSFKYFFWFPKNICLSNQSLNCKNNQCLYCHEFFSSNLIFFFLGIFFCCYYFGEFFVAEWMVDWEFLALWVFLYSQIFCGFSQFSTKI